jgi:hypothetical protein
MLYPYVYGGNNDYSVNLYYFTFLVLVIIIINNLLYIFFLIFISIN